MDNNKPDLQGLIEKLQNGSIMPAERQLLTEWYNQLNIADPDAWEFEGEEEIIRQELLSGIKSRLRKGRLIMLYRIAGWSAAAVFLLLLSVWGLWHKGIRGGNEDKPLAWMVFSNDSILPMKIGLPDGSTAWLNSGSHLRLNERFGKDNRTVYADGELLLDVWPDNTRPFRVVTRNITTTVLGTLFNIEAYTEEKEMKISLLKGKVLVTDSSSGTETLQPGQSAISGGPGRLRVSLLDNSNAGSWTRGGLVFNETLLSDALHRMERKYKITFQYEPALLSDQRITTSLGEGADWETALKSMLFIHNIQFKKINQIVRLYR